MTTSLDAVRRPPARGDEPLTSPTVRQRRQVLLLGVALLAATVTSTLATFGDPWFDQSLGRWLQGQAGLDAPSAIALTAGPVLLGVLAATMLLGRRCRTFVGVAAASTAVAYGTALLLGQVMPRQRPPASLVRTPDSYPDPWLLVLVVLAGLVPMAMRPVTKPVVRRVAVGLLTVLLAARALASVHEGHRWPLDVLGATLIGAVIVLLARVLLEEPRRHRWCARCWWQQRAVREPAASPAVLLVTPRRAVLLHRITLGWVALVVAGYVVVGLTRGLPRAPQSGVIGSGLEVPLQWAALSLVVLGVLVARRRHLTGAVLVALSATVLGYGSSAQYPPVVALCITAVLWVPALLLWLEWHRLASLRTAVVAAVATSLVLGSVVAAAGATFASFWGPTHPQSATVAPSTDVVSWMWAGGVTTTGADVRLRTAEPASSIRLLVGRDRALGDGTPSVAVRPDDDRVAAVRLRGLRPDTTYYYAAEVDGVPALDRVQRLRTFPDGAASFTFAVGSCLVGGSNGQVFDTVRDKDPLFFLATGDWHYGNIEANDVSAFRDQYELNLTSPAQAALYASAPIAYVWDDHDFGGNDADRTSSSKEAASAAYRQLVPHYPLATRQPDGPVHQAFTVGRVRFLVTDTRAARDPADQPSGPFRSTLGAQQREWLLDELAQADRYALVVWVSPDPWVAPPRDGADTWGGFAEERRLVADAIAGYEVDNLLMVSGDAHMLAFDDGTNTDYSTTKGAAFPLFHAAPLDRPGNPKGGPYTGPVLTQPGQFGTVEVRDDGAAAEVRLTGWRWDGAQLFTRTVRFGQQ